MPPLRRHAAVLEDAWRDEGNVSLRALVRSARLTLRSAVCAPLSHTKPSQQESVSSKGDEVE